MGSYSNSPKNAEMQIMVEQAGNQGPELSSSRVLMSNKPKNHLLANFHCNVNNVNIYTNATRTPSQSDQGNDIIVIYSRNGAD